jgi:hypothetical protein
MKIRKTCPTCENKHDEEVPLTKVGLTSYGAQEDAVYIGWECHRGHIFESGELEVEEEDEYY